MKFFVRKHWGRGLEVYFIPKGIMIQVLIMQFGRPVGEALATIQSWLGYPEKKTDHIKLNGGLQLRYCRECLSLDVQKDVTALGYDENPIVETPAILEFFHSGSRVGRILFKRDPKNTKAIFAEAFGDDSLEPFDDGITVTTEDEMVAIGRPGRVMICKGEKVLETLLVEAAERPAANGTAPAAVFRK